MIKVYYNGNNSSSNSSNDSNNSNTDSSWPIHTSRSNRTKYKTLPVGLTLVTLLARYKRHLLIAASCNHSSSQTQSENLLRNCILLTSEQFKKRELLLHFVNTNSICFQHYESSECLGYRSIN